MVATVIVVGARILERGAIRCARLNVAGVPATVVRRKGCCPLFVQRTVVPSWTVRVGGAKRLSYAPTLTVVIGFAGVGCWARYCVPADGLYVADGSQLGGCE